MMAKKKKTGGKKSSRKDGDRTRKSSGVRIQGPSARSSDARAQTRTMWNLVLSGKADAHGIEALLLDGADASRRDSEGYTVLHEACRGGMADVARVLLAHGADAEAVGGGGAARPLHLAAMGDHAATVEQLLAAPPLIVVYPLPPSTTVVYLLPGRWSSCSRPLPS